MPKFALIHLGNEEQYGLLFAASEFKKYGEIRFFDAEMDDSFWGKVVEYDADYICFSLLTAFVRKAKEIIPRIISHKSKIIIGGQHTLYEDFDADYIIRGTAHNVFEKIGKEKIIVNPPCDPNEYPLPSREEYYRDIPRLKTRYRKVMASMFGCPFNCSYCAANIGNLVKLWGAETHRRAYLTRRNIDTLIKEAEFIKDSTSEIEWVDDDFFYGEPQWIMNFIKTWREKINIPLYISTTSKSIINTDNKLLRQLRSIVNCIGVGIQAVEPISLALFNRQWDSEEQMRRSYKKLKNHGFQVNLQAIVGLPVKEPLIDALATLEGLKDIGKGEVVSIYPLQLYRGTKLYDYCIENKIPLNDKCNGDTNSGIPAVKFTPQIETYIKNICKLGTMIVKYNIPFDWYMPLLGYELDELTSKELSTARYHECITARLGEKGDEIFQDIMKGMHIKY